MHGVPHKRIARRWPSPFCFRSKLRFVQMALVNRPKARQKWDNGVLDVKDLQSRHPTASDTVSWPPIKGPETLLTGYVALGSRARSWTTSETMSFGKILEPLMFMLICPWIEKGDSMEPGASVLYDEAEQTRKKKNTSVRWNSRTWKH